ncbi:hypothetical protein BGZ83_006796 [Gryganskiella cystojenkinii]|nr:hypothetical protein BGZ83_006796 [Gryganskiella cystojenkinii]
MKPTLEPLSSSSPSLFAIADIPELLLLISRHLSSHDLANACRVSKQWHLILTPSLWRSIRIKSPHAQLALFQPETLQALYKHGHHVRVLTSCYGSILDIFRQQPLLIKGFCLCNRLFKLELQDSAEDDGYMDHDPDRRSRWLAMALVARHNFENTQRSMNRVIKAAAGLPPDQEYEDEYLDPTEPPYTFTLPMAEEDENQDEITGPMETQILHRRIQLLIHPPELDPLLNLLRHNPGLRSLVILNFPTWSERAIRLICRESLPLLEELNLLSPRSGLISARLMRILLEGLSPRLKRIKFQIRDLHADDPMTDDQRAQFWKRRSLRHQHNIKDKDDINKEKADNSMIEQDEEEYDLEDLAVYNNIEQVESFRTVIPFIRRCHRLGRLAINDLPESEETMAMLVWTLYEHCPKLHTLRLYFNALPDQHLEQILLSSRQGWRELGISFSKLLGPRAVKAILGSGDLSRPRQPLLGAFSSLIPMTAATAMTSTTISMPGAEEHGMEVEVAIGMMTSLNLAGSEMIVLRPRLRILEKLQIEGCGVFTSMDLQTILCSCPVLRVLVALSGSYVPETADPILEVSDMMKLVLGTVVVGTQDFGITTTNTTTSAQEEAMTDVDEHERPKWACLGLEILCLRIQCSVRPDLRVRLAMPPNATGGFDYHGGDLDTEDHDLDLTAVQRSRDEQRVVYRQLGQLTKLRIFRTGYHGGENWVAATDQQWNVRFLDTSVAAAVPSSQTTTETIFPLSSASHASRAVVVGTRYQQKSLEWSLDSGLRLMLQGTPNMEAIDLHQMASRIGLPEVQAMTDAWPKLRHLGLIQEARRHHGHDNDDDDDDDDGEEEEEEVEDDEGQDENQDEEITVEGGSLESELNDQDQVPMTNGQTEEPTTEALEDIVVPDWTQSPPIGLEEDTSQLLTAHVVWLQEHFSDLEIVHAYDEDEEDEEEHWSQWN